MIDIRDRIAGGLWGLLIGDALGVPYEFNAPEYLPALDKIEFNPPAGFIRSHKRVLPGTWSDDGAQALCLLDSLLECGTLNINDFAERLLKWYENGLWAVDNDVFDVGNQTADAIAAYKHGADASKAGFVRPDGKGNGSLMRVLPLVLWHRGDDEELANYAHLQSVATHGHVCNQVCCALYCLWARRLLDGYRIEEAYRLAVEKLRGIYDKDSDYYSELEWSIRPDDPAVGNGGGYVIDSFRSVRMVMQYDTFEMTLKKAVSLGNDTDTTAAIAGGLAGIYYGLNNIPKRWFDELRAKDLVNPLIDKLMDLCI